MLNLLHLQTYRNVERRHGKESFRERFAKLTASHYHNHIYGVLNRKFNAQPTLRVTRETQGNNSLTTRKSFIANTWILIVLFLFSLPRVYRNNFTHDVEENRRNQKWNSSDSNIVHTRIESIKYLTYPPQISKIVISVRFNFASRYQTPPPISKSNKKRVESVWSAAQFVPSV